MHSNKTNIQIPLLMYHEVTDENKFGLISKKIQHSFIVTKDNFDRQILFLKQNGFNAISLDQIIHFMRGDKQRANISQKSVLITFDDGYLGNYEFAFPILEKYKFVATFFIIVDRMNKEKMLTWEQTKEMGRYGMSIQSHTMSHLLFSQLDNNKTKEELYKSKMIIEEKIGTEVKYISLPNGDYNKYYRYNAIETGYQGGCSSRFGFNDGKTDPYFLKRIPIKDNYDISLFEDILTSDPATIKRMKYQYMAKHMVTRILTKPIYNKLYNLFYGIEEY